MQAHSIISYHIMTYHIKTSLPEESSSSRGSAAGEEAGVEVESKVGCVWLWALAAGEESMLVMCVTGFKDFDLDDLLLPIYARNV